MSYLIRNIILHGFQNVINASHIYRSNQKLFDSFVQNHIPTGDIKDAALKLIILFTEYEQLMNPSNTINDWHTYINELEVSNRSQSLINGWKNHYRREYQDTHFVPLSMPITFHGKPLALNIIFYWILHKFWFDNNLIITAWYGSKNTDVFIGKNIFDFTKRFFLYCPNDIEINRFRRFLLIEGSITVGFESLIYINPLTTIIYIIFILIPRLLNRGAIGSPILIIIFHLILLARFFI